MEDHKIIELFCDRSEQAINELMKKYGRGCTKIAQNILKNELDAEECVNDACLGVWNTVPPKKPSSLPAYFYRIVRNVSIKRYHQNTAEKRNSYYDVALEEIEECLADGGSIEEEYIYKELSLLINIFLEGLNKKDRIMFVKRYWFGTSISEISDSYNTSNHHVTVRLWRIREKLKKYLQQKGVLI